MAESTENAIPNKKNSEKHVVIVPIDVHHRHDSQVSQILDPDKASDITKAQQKNLEVVHHQDDGILQADDSLNKSHAFVGLPCQDINATCKRTPAERMRDYRARKKIYLQSTSDSSSVVHHQDDEILLTDDNLNSSHELVGLPCQDINATRKKTPAERMRDFD
ncbi:hypothetical protein TNCT_285141 [Trichonephila clavata]|uniref:Uncharacterized protein n=1 Tax=Trichonephila clavata TaxID=2740835 RepID=A0A8X6H391_TRICU|nr:hypothetical protein TNCT_285141 [Trichonephila clavata]